MAETTKLLDQFEKCWKKEKHRLIFRGTKQEFDEWKKLWYKLVPRCDKFKCVHDSMSCGICIACGDCSIHRYQSQFGCSYICTSVSCIDCTKRYDCEFRPHRIHE